MPTKPDIKSVRYPDWMFLLLSHHWHSSSWYWQRRFCLPNSTFSELVLQQASSSYYHSKTTVLALIMADNGIRHPSQWTRPVERGIRRESFHGPTTFGDPAIAYKIFLLYVQQQNWSSELGLLQSLVIVRWFVITQYSNKIYNVLIYDVTALLE